MVRYYRIAARKGQRSAFVVGLLQGALRSLRWNHRRPVGPDVFQQFTLMEQIEQSLRSLQKEMGLRSVLFIDYGKNILPYWLAARRIGLKVVAIADERLAQTGKYRGIPIVDDALARTLEFDAAIVSNSSPVHAQLRAKAWRELDRRPVVDLLGPIPHTITLPTTAQQGTELAA